MRRILFITLLVVLGTGGATPAWADSGYEGEDLSLRMAAAFVRLLEVSAMGGETAANRWSPAVNPASADWTCIERRAGVVAAGNYSHNWFATDNTIDLYGLTGLWDTRRYGTIVVTGSVLRSNEEPDRTGLIFDYETDTLQIQYAKRVHNWSVGLAFNYADSTVEQRTPLATVTSTTAKTYRWRLGALWEPVCKLLIGVVGEYATSPYDWSAIVPTPVGPLPVAGEDTQEHVIGRVAASYEYCPYSVVWADYQYSWYENERGELTSHRGSAGVQHNLFRFLFLRGGLSVDQEGNLGVLTGVGAAFARWGSIDFGYQYGMFPELEPNFGKSHTFQAVLAIRF